MKVSLVPIILFIFAPDFSQSACVASKVSHRQVSGRADGSRRADGSNVRGGWVGREFSRHI